MKKIVRQAITMILVLSIVLGGVPGLSLKIQAVDMDQARNSAKLNMKRISAGANHLLIIGSNKEIKAWGNEVTGRYDGVAHDLATISNENIVEVSSGSAHSMAMDSEGNLIVWGPGERYTTEHYIEMPEEARTGISAVSAGGFTYAVLKEGRIYSWGYDEDFEATVPDNIQGDIVAIDSGYSHSLALKNNGEVVSWGYASNDGATIIPDNAKSGVNTISAGYRMNLAIKDGEVLAWGNNQYGAVTVPESAKSDVVAISASKHALALKSNGEVIAWGDQADGKCEVPEGAKTGVVAIEAADTYSVAMKADGSIVIWGACDYKDDVLAAAPTLEPLIAGFPRAIGVTLTDSTENQKVYNGDAFTLTGSIDNNDYGTVTVEATMNKKNSGEEAIPAQIKQVIIDTSTTTDFTMTWQTNEIDDGIYSIDVTANNGTGDSGSVSSMNEILVVKNPQYYDATGAPSNMSKLSILHSHAAVVKSDGTVSTWGKFNTIPSEVEGNITKVATGHNYTIALTDQGKIYSWDSNGLETIANEDIKNIKFISATYQSRLAVDELGKVHVLGSGPVADNADMNQLSSGVLAVAGGWGHAIALKEDKSIVVWGDNGKFQLQVPDEAKTGISAIAAGIYHSLVVKNGEVFAWGRDLAGETAVPEEAKSDVVAVAAGFESSLALKNTGEVIAWGNNSEGQSTVPAEAKQGVVAIASGKYVSIALKADGSIIQWGSGTDVNGYQKYAMQEGTEVTVSTDGFTTSTNSVPDLTITNPLNDVTIEGSTGTFELVGTVQDADGDSIRVTATIGGVTKTEVIDNPQVAKAWTLSWPLSELSSGEYRDLLVTATEIKDTGAINVDMQWNQMLRIMKEGTGGFILTREQAGKYEKRVSNYYNHVALISEDGSVEAWGNDSGGKLDIPTEATNNVKQVTVGTSHTVALKNDGTVIGWGYGDNVVQYGGPGQDEIVQIESGSDYVIGLKRDGSIVNLQLTGQGHVAAPNNIPVEDDPYIAIDGGYFHMLALQASGKVSAWGQNSRGQRDIPEEAEAGVEAISTGVYHNLALKDGQVIAWGDNNSGECEVPNDAQSGVVAISAGMYHSLALREDGRVVAWGNNSHGQINVPGLALNHVIAIGAGKSQSVAIRDDGTVVVWGLGTTDYQKNDVPTGLKMNVNLDNMLEPVSKTVTFNGQEPRYNSIEFAAYAIDDTELETLLEKVHIDGNQVTFNNLYRDQQLILVAKKPKALPIQITGTLEDLAELSFGKFLVGDMDEDGSINVSDLARFISLYDTNDLEGDINEDGSTNVSDLGLFISAYTILN